ncbi:hypothetical protein [Spirosoma pulveris]
MNHTTEMDELDKNLPDDFWRKTFDEAAETPPPRVWAAIERKLDEADGPKVIPLWGSGLASSRPLIWGSGLAAAVALLLVGWWAIRTASTPTTPLAHSQRTASSENAIALSKQKELTAARSPESGLANGSTTTGNAARQHAIASSSAPFRLNPGRFQRDATGRPARRKDASETTGPTEHVFDSGLATFQQHIATVDMSQRTQSVVSRMAAVSYSADHHARSGIQAFGANTAVAFDKLAGRPMRLRTVGAIQRIVWARPAEASMDPEITKSKQKSRELWASVSMMPGSFNPAVAVKEAQPSFSNSLIASPTSSNQSAVSSRASFSVAYQAGAGVQLTDHWSVESGVGYLSGRSTVETPAQQYLASVQMDALSNRNTGLNNLYADALRSSVRSSDLANAPQANYSGIAANNYKSAYDSRNIQAVTNDYQFVQVPVQVGYQFRPRKKLSMAVLGGLLTNIFVKNTVGDALVITSKDGVYRPVSLAATMGARVRYRPSRQWSASVAGVYQPSLESSTRSDAQVQNHPTSAGMSFGVDYHF